MTHLTPQALEQTRSAIKIACDQLKIPEHMHSGILAYVMKGRKTGGFLELVFSGQNFSAKQKADPMNLAAFASYEKLLLFHLPNKCWSTPEHYRTWIEKGGLEGTADD